MKKIIVPNIYSESITYISKLNKKLLNIIIRKIKTTISYLKSLVIKLVDLFFANNVYKQNI